MRRIKGNFNPLLYLDEDRSSHSPLLHTEKTDPSLLMEILKGPKENKVHLISPVSRTNSTTTVFYFVRTKDSVSYLLFI